MRAVILAAGKGTRMGDLTKDTPKPMIKVADKPVLEHTMRRLMAAGVSDFVLVTKYLAEKIEDHFGDGSSMGVRVEYVEQPDRYGTGAALLAAKELARGEPLLMTFADVITSIKTYAQAISIFGDKSGSGVITLNWVPDPCTGAAVMVNDGGRVCDIIEKPPKGTIPSHWNSSGIFVFDTIIFDYLEKLTPSARGEYELPDAMNGMIADGLSIYPSYMEGDWLDVGTVEALSVAERMLAQGQPSS